MGSAFLDDLINGAHRHRRGFEVREEKHRSELSDLFYGFDLDMREFQMYRRGHGILLGAPVTAHELAGMPAEDRAMVALRSRRLERLFGGRLADVTHARIVSLVAGSMTQSYDLDSIGESYGLILTVRGGPTRAASTGPTIRDTAKPLVTLRYTAPD